MPELPEVETMRRGIAAIAGSRIVSARPVPCRHKRIAIGPRPADFARRAQGRKIVSIERVGKRVVLRLDSDDAIVFEPRMTGLVLLADPPNREHLRFRVRLCGGEVEQLLYWDRRGLGSVRLLSPRQFAKQFGPDKLGPDALAVDWRELRDRFRDSRREVKVALLDQRAVAGLGNLYASEILHVAGVHPERRCDRLRADQWRKVHAAMRKILAAAIRYEGSTLGDGTYRNALNQSGSYQNHHRVYGRQGETCPSCRQSRIVRIVQAQRSTFYCPTCQRRPPRPRKAR